MAPKLTSCDVFGMLLKYWLSTEGRFGGERVNPVGVLVSGGLPWRLMSGIVAGGDMTHSCDDEWCSVTFAAVMFADCVTVWAAAAVLVDVLVLSVAAVAVLAAVTLWNAVVKLPTVAASAASVAVAACFAVEHVAVDACFAVERIAVAACFAVERVCC